MKLLRLVTVLVTCVAVTLPASACCLFPWLPTYGGYGYGYGCGYRSCGYAPAPYSVGYGCYSGCSTCGQSACSACSTCGSSCGSYCGSSCGSACGGSCGATEVRKEPAPDPISRDRRNDDRDKTFQGGNYNNDPARSRDDSTGDFGAGTRSDDFGAGTSTSDEADRWSPGGSGEEAEKPFGLDDIPNGSDFDGSSSRKPATDGLGESGTVDDGAGTGPVDFEARKPPVGEPVDDSNGGKADASETSGTEVDSTDFLTPPADVEGAVRPAGLLSARESRSSHFGVITRTRLATGSTQSAARATMISSGRTKQAPVRWISVPRPADRVQL